MTAYEYLNQLITGLLNLFNMQIFNGYSLIQLFFLSSILGLAISTILGSISSIHSSSLINKFKITRNKNTKGM